MVAKSFTLALALLLDGLVSAIDNGLGLIPPRGWRSWNAFDCMEEKTIITQDHMAAQMVAVLEKSRLVDGKLTSLAELGFNYVSMDDGWQKCNCSTRQDVDPALPTCPNLCFGGHCTWHSDSGIPLVRESRFPDMKSLVAYGHSLGLHVGGYLNNCICMEAGKSPTHYEQDVQWMLDMNFDEVKIDSCGSSTNVAHWAELFNASGKPMRIENCHNGWPDFKTGFCPMNFFRTGGDISHDIGDILGQAYATVDASDLPEPRSRPGCWGYPDMSEVGNFPDQPGRFDKEQTHWGLWCTISSPLILGFDMNNTDTMNRVWPLITNTDALAVSGAWAGHPGTLTRVYPAIGQGFQMSQAECDGSPRTVGWKFQDGDLVAPRLDAMEELQCLRPPAGGACPPPTSRFWDVQCGLLLGKCAPGSHSGRWDFVGSQIQWSTGKPQDKPSCAAASPLKFDVTQGYFVRQAATVKMGDCATFAKMPRNSSCVAPRNGVDVSDPEVIPPLDPKQVCGVDVQACCKACDENEDCKAYVWKASEPYGIGCKGSGSYCWLLSGLSGLHAGPGTFGTKGPAPPMPPVPPAPAPPQSPAAFNLTDKGELRAADGKCLAAVPVNGVELWSKPMSASKVATLFVNPTAASQRFSFPLEDIPHFDGANIECSPGTCVAKDVWARTDFVLDSSHIDVVISAFASAFFIIERRQVDEFIDILNI